MEQQFLLSLFFEAKICLLNGFCQIWREIGRYLVIQRDGQVMIMEYNGFKDVLNHIHMKKPMEVEPLIWKKTDAGYRLLILDGHGSHVTGEFLGYCIQHKIVLLVLPPHTSHLTQPLDV